MPSGPSRRSLLASLAALAAWILGHEPAPVAQTTTAAPPPVVRVPDRPGDPWSPRPSGTMVYSASSLPPGLSLDPSTGLLSGTLGYAPVPPGAGETVTITYGTSGIPVAPPPIVHAACRLESPAGEALGREEYEVVVEDGGRFVRVTTLDAAGTYVKSERLPF